MRLKWAARRCLRRDGGGQVEGLPLLWVGLGGERKGSHAGLCVLGAHGVAHDGRQMRKQAAKAQGWRPIGKAAGLSLRERGGRSLRRSHRIALASLIGGVAFDSAGNIRNRAEYASLCQPDGNVDLPRRGFCIYIRLGPDEGNGIPNRLPPAYDSNPRSSF